MSGIDYYQVLHYLQVTNQVQAVISGDPESKDMETNLVGSLCVFLHHAPSNSADRKQIRDQQTSAALGLPSRIRNEDCEVADLSASDFEDDGEPCEVFRKPPVGHIAYVIGMVELAKFRMFISKL